MNVRNGIFMALLGVGIATCAVAVPQTEVEVLLNGTDLSNWTCLTMDPTIPMDEVWKVQEDGSLLCTGAMNACLRTKRDDYENYILELDWRWKSGGNSGVLVHSHERIHSGIVWPRSVEIQLGYKIAGDFVVRRMSPFTVPDAETRKKGEVYTRLPSDSEKNSGEWSHLEVICNGGEITTKVNGEVVNYASNCGEAYGAICLQSEHNEVHFRNMVVKPLGN